MLTEAGQSVYAVRVISFMWHVPHCICGKNRVFPVRAVREQCSFRDVILGACIVRTERRREDGVAA